MSFSKEDQVLALRVSADIFKERMKQNEKWGRQRHENGGWLPILIEEVGEVGQAMQQGSVASKDTDKSDLYEELIQVAAVATAWAEQLLEEEAKGESHEQAYSKEVD